MTTRRLDAAMSGLQQALLTRIDALPRHGDKIRVADLAHLHRELADALAATPGAADAKVPLSRWIDRLDPRHHIPPVPVVTITILRCPHCTARKPRYDGRRGTMRRYVCRTCGLAFKALERDPTPA